MKTKTLFNRLCLLPRYDAGAQPVFRIRPRPRCLRIAWLLLVLAPFLSTPARADQEGDFEFETGSEGVEITRYLGPGGGVVIPEFLDGNSVVAIGRYAFSGVTSLTNVTIPDSVTVIGESAFSDCTGLRTVTIGNGVTDIGAGAFSGCTGLTSVTIPNSVTLIQPGLMNFDALHLPGAFEGCSGLTNVTIGTGLSTIGAFTFRRCTSLTGLTIPDSVTTIEGYAFSDCTGLTTVTIPSSVTYIGRGAIFGCVLLGGCAAFGGCTGLTSVYFEGDAPNTVGTEFDGSAFATVFYRSGASGWVPTFDGRPTALWSPLTDYATWATTTGLMAQFPSASGEADDPDNDGVINHDEWLAGTDPTQRASTLALELVPRLADLAESDKTPVPDGYHALYFGSVPGRYYGVQRADSLQGPWALQAVAIAAANTTQTRFLVPKPQANAFYRVSVETRR